MLFEMFQRIPFFCLHRDSNEAGHSRPCLIPALRKQKQKDHQFKVNLGHIARPCLKKAKRISPPPKKKENKRKRKKKKTRDEQH
jgi:hypothetical protein